MSAQESSRDDAEPPSRQPLQSSAGSVHLTVHTTIEPCLRCADIPADDLIHHWIGHTVQSQPDFDETLQYEVSLSVVDAQAIQTLNRDYRKKDAPTNVLSFPSGMPVMPATDSRGAMLMLGDIVICQSVIADEAQAQRKSIEHHWVHMMVHSVLHLFGHDHLQPDEAQAMEALEVDLLEHLSVPNPYQLHSPV